MSALPVTVTRWQPSPSRTRLGFADLLFEKIGLTIRACEVHAFTSYGGERRTWMQYPGRPYSAQGVRRTFAVIFFTRHVHEEIVDQVIAALRALAPDVFADVTVERAA